MVFTRASMSAFWPAPSTIVVLSLSTLIALGGAEVLEGQVLELEAEILGDRLAAGQDRDVLQHLLAAIAEARGLDRADLQRAAQLVDDQGRQGLAVDVLGQDQERAARLGHLLEERQELLHVRDLLLVSQHEAVIQDRLHALRVGHEVRRQVAAVELHALDHVELGVERLRLLDGDHALLADLVHRLGDHVADRGVAVGGDRADLGDLLVVLGVLRLGLQVRDDLLDRDVDAALDLHRVVPGGDQLGALAEDRLGQDGRGGGAVAGVVGGLGRDLLHHLRAHVLELVLELDLLGDGDAVLGDRGRAPALLDHDVAAARAEGDLDGIGEDVDAPTDRGAGALVENDVLGAHG
jgi:hypothetical protein